MTLPESSTTNLRTIIAFALLLLTGQWLYAESITYRIVEYNTSTQTFILAPCGERPCGSYAFFENDYGATTGNRYNQIPRNRQATLWLTGWQDCTIHSVTLSMCSNNSSGTVGLSIKQGDTTFFEQKPEPFNSDTWFGMWVSKDHQMYVDIKKELPSPLTVNGDSDVEIVLKGGTPEGSVYLSAITIDYTPGTHVSTESPLGWTYEKIEAKGAVNDGDILMMYRSGDAAGDIDGMQNQHYLDAIGVSSTANVDDPFISLFTAHTTDDGHFTLTNQYGELLGATGAQSLAWDDGITTWDITLGYDGATIASTNSKYGTMRYNAPAGSYPRFWNYTSKSLSLPYLYRRTRQLQPITSTAINLSDNYREATLGEQDTLIIHHTLLPVNCTDKRVTWKSSDEQVATVHSGIVSIIAPGDAIITATAADGGSSSTCTIHVSEQTDGIVNVNENENENVYSIDGQRVTDNYRGIIITNGKKRIKQ